ncbi:MAG: glycosyltransferase family 2 protein [Pirellula sp.]|jgi:GT2 family glycosyltransferase|nr:glycosyltransferase family 2 protein [Pirellula sp.]
MSTTDNSQKPLISIGIATFNRCDLLQRALESLGSLRLNDAYKMEIVVIDNGSTDQTREVVQSMSFSSIPIRWVFEERPGLPFARNRAVQEAKGEWVAFFDDDQLVEPNWLNTLYNTVVEEGLDCAGGARTLRIETEGPPPQLPAFSRMLLGEITIERPHFYHKQHLPCTGNVLIAKSVFDRVGMFDETVLDGGEDTDFFNRMFDAGIRAKYIPTAVVEHIIAPRRLEHDYLELIAFRHGRHVCRRDLKLHGVPYALVSGLLRFGVIGLPWIVRMSILKLLGKKHEAIAAYCKYRRVCGYWSYLKQHRDSSPEEIARTMHRGKG